MTGLFGEFRISENDISVFQNCTIGSLSLHSPFFIFVITKILLHSPTFHPHLGLTSLFPVLCINISHFFVTVLFLLLRSSSWFSIKSSFCSLSDVLSSSLSSEEISSSSKLSVIWPPVDQGLALPEIVKLIRNQPRVSFSQLSLCLPSFETGTPVPLWFTTGI